MPQPPKGGIWEKKGAGARGGLYEAEGEWHRAVAKEGGILEIRLRGRNPDGEREKKKI